MALMIPAIVPEGTVSGAERQLFPVFRDGLDESYTIFHSFKTVSPNREGQLVDTEIDYLIFSPTEGLLVLEVKGGPVVFDGSRGRWYQGEKPIRDPFKQATDNKYKLRSYLQQRIGRTTPLALAHAVCFPGTSGKPTHLPPQAARNILITGDDLETIANAIQLAYSQFKRPTRSLSEKESKSLRLALMPLCEYGVSLRDRIGEAEKKLFSLTQEQCRLLDALRYHRHALIQGCAGSGKTIMAVKKAQELATEGRSVLLLAFNQMIGERLRQAVIDMPNIVAGTYHDYCLNRLAQADRIPEGPQDNDFYNRLVPQAFLELVSASTDRFDALIVDEGQDFRTDFWISLSYLVHDDGHFYIFYDPDQNVFGSEMAFPLDCTPIVLSYNCRNSKHICTYVADHTGQHMQPMESTPLGDPVETSINQSPVGRRRKLASILNRLINEEGLNTGQVVILGGHNIDKTCIPADGRLGVFSIIENAEPERNVIPYHTYMKFKGCEAEAVILLDVDPADVRWPDRAIYTTASRARHLLYVIRSR